MKGSISNVILDFDGTLTDTEKEAVPFLERWEEVFSEITGLEKKEFIGLAEKIREEVRSDPEEGWEYKGLIVAPATADPYILTTTVYRKVIEKLINEGRGKMPEDAGHFLNYIFGICHGSAGVAFRPGAKEFLEGLMRDYRVMIVTNSQTDSVRQKAAQLSKVNVEVIGGAKKYAVDNSWQAVPEFINLEGLKRPVCLRRRNYSEILENFRPEETAVVGDIFELDLALPQYLGYRAVLLQTPGTLPHEKRYLQSQTNSFLARDFNEVRRAL